MRATSLLAATLLVGFALFACSSDSFEEEVTIDFTRGPLDWVAEFADYPVGQEAAFELTADFRPLPPPLDSMGSALYSSGNNRSADLFMFWKGKVVGFDEGDTRRVTFMVEIATSVPGGCTGAGGAPGESVFVKAGASRFEPEAVAAGGTYVMNVDKGEQSAGGSDAVVLGDVANSQSCGEEPRWELKELSSSATIEVTADGQGMVWLFVGSDSGFAGTTSLYFTKIRARFD